jgi:hypothetical protein
MGWRELNMFVFILIVYLLGVLIGYLAGGA